MHYDVAKTLAQSYVQQLECIEGVALGEKARTLQQSPLPAVTITCPLIHSPSRTHSLVRGVL